MIEFLQHTPAEQWRIEWKEDYERMCQTMINGEKLPFEKLIERMVELQERFRPSKAISV